MIRTRWRFDIEEDYLTSGRMMRQRGWSATANHDAARDTVGTELNRRRANTEAKRGQRSERTCCVAPAGVNVTLTDESEHSLPNEHDLHSPQPASGRGSTVVTEHCAYTTREGADYIVRLAAWALGIALRRAYPAACSSRKSPVDDGAEPPEEGRAA